MKTYITTTIAVLITVLSFAQQGINYKALIKDANGLLIHIIGTSTNVIIGMFNDIDWTANRHFLQTTIDYSGGTA